MNGNLRVVGEIDGGGGLKASQLRVYQIVPYPKQNAVVMRASLNVDGDVTVKGDIRLANADCAEHFSIGTASLAEAGTVMVLGDNGELFPCQSPYDKRVAGVVSGAGTYKPGILLDDQTNNKNRSHSPRQPIALLGKVFCWVDADYHAIEVGDLLTTSPTLGHAMKAEDRQRAFGSVIGKALAPCAKGRILIPILVALQ